jgi:major capsid protein gp7
MATLGANVLTLSDWAKRLDPDGSTARIVELLEQSNELLQDIVWSQGNLPTGHRITVRTGLPAVAWRLLNQGVVPSKSTTAQLDEQSGMLEAWAEVDKDLAELNGNSPEFRLSEARSFIESMNQEMIQTIFYGNSSLAPEEFTGLSVRYSDIGSGSPANSQNIIDAGGTDVADSSSIWLVGWGENTISGIFPKGSKAGLLHEDLGLVTVEVTAGVGGARMRAYQDRWQWKAGIALHDWRYVVRIANIDVSALVAQSSAVVLSTALIKAIHRLPSRSNIRPVFYMNRTVFEFLDIQARTEVGTGGQLSFTNWAGQPILSFRDIPIRKVDQLLETEARVV